MKNRSVAITAKAENTAARGYQIDNRIFMMVRKAFEKRQAMREQYGEYSLEHIAARAALRALWDVVEEFELVDDWLIYDEKNPVNMDIKKGGEHCE